MWSTIALTVLLTAVLNVHVCRAAGFAYVWQTFDDNNNVLLGIPEAFKWQSPPAPPGGTEEIKSGEVSMSEKSMEDPTSRAGSVEEGSPEGSEGSAENPSVGSKEGGSSEGGSSESSPGSGESSTSSRETEKEPGTDTKEETTPTTSSLFPPKTFKSFPPISYSPPIPFAYSKKSFGTYTLPRPLTASLSFPPPTARIQYLPYKSPVVYSSQILSAAPGYLPIRTAPPPPPPPPPPPYTIPVPAAAAYSKGSANIFYNPYITSNITAIPAPPPPPPTVIKAPRITAISPKIAAATSPLRIYPALPPAPSAPFWFY